LWLRLQAGVRVRDELTSLWNPEHQIGERQICDELPVAEQRPNPALINLIITSHEVRV